jgi:hypothetical protein
MFKRIGRAISNTVSNTVQTVIDAAIYVFWKAFVR